MQDDLWLLRKVSILPLDNRMTNMYPSLTGK